MENEEGSVGISRIRASIRVFAEDLDPELVTRALGAEPSMSWRRGDPRPANKGHVARTGMWLLESTAAPSSDPDIHLRTLLQQLRVDQPAWDALRRTVSCDVYFGLFQDQPNSFFSIGPDLFQSLGALGFIVCFSLYAPPPDSDGSSSDQ